MFHRKNYWLNVMGIVLIAGAASAWRLDSVAVASHGDETGSVVRPAVEVKTGTFRDGDRSHRGSGRVVIDRLPDGSHVLRLEDFRVSSGPDLHVILTSHANPATSNDVRAGGYVDLGLLRRTRGDQEYQIPADVDVAEQGSVVIYCKRFNVIFSVATLTDSRPMDDMESHPMDDMESRPMNDMESHDMGPMDPATARRASVDRFSEKAGKLFVRNGANGLPGANEPIDFDKAPFITQGLGPKGVGVRYYNFDVQGTTPAPIYVLFREGESKPVTGQLNIVDVIPGDEGYNDFWRVTKVTVPKNYVANTVTSVSEIADAGYSTETTNKLVNCPIVPAGSTARMRLGGEGADLHEGWYRGQVVSYFTFEEKALTTGGSGGVRLSPIYVAFNVNPNQPGGGPASGFMTEAGTSQTHNVLQTIPSDAGYSPLWLVNVYDKADFPKVKDLKTAVQATILGAGVATVNCPVVFVEDTM